MPKESQTNASRTRATPTSTDVESAKVAIGMAEIRLLYAELHARITKATRVLNAANDALAELQAQCPHISKHSQPEYDFIAYWCNDCGKRWQGRTH
jgi:hypothetical protein